jgi:hypothetical protein
VNDIAAVMLSQRDQRNSLPSREVIVVMVAVAVATAEATLQIFRML